MVSQANHFPAALCPQVIHTYRVIAAGLDMDYEGKPFGPMPYLLAVAEFVTKVHAICARTGELASFTYRLNDDERQVMLGEKDKYEARSRRAFLDGMQKRKKSQ